jgi:hypothetical protein
MRARSARVSVYSGGRSVGERDAEPGELDGGWLVRWVGRDKVGEEIAVRACGHFWRD